MTAQQKYRHCMVLAGGGFRFAYYLGMYAAAEDRGDAPDVLLATCGGALAAATICALPDQAARKAWLASPEMYAFLCGFSPGPGAGLLRAVAGLVARAARPGCRSVPDLFGDYMFQPPGDLPLPRTGDGAAKPDWAIVGARMEFAPSDVGRPVRDKALYTECVFGSGRVAGLVHGMASPMRGTPWGSRLVAQEIDANVELPLHVAARVSMSDVLYFPSCHHGGSDYSGGLVDLFPIEVAHRLAERVTMERKAPFSRLTAAPALRNAFGIDGNARLCHVHRQRADRWIDTRDVARVMRSQAVGKGVSWRTGRFELRPPERFAEYQAQIEAQWQYGYARASEAFKEHAAAAEAREEELV